MQVQTLIDEFADIGIRLTAESGRVIFEGPREMLTPARIDELRRHKAELLAALATPDFDAGLLRQGTETLAGWEHGFNDVDSLHSEVVRRWAAEIDQLAKLRAVSPEGAKALKQAQTFISDGWALQAVQLGWDEVELFGVCPRAPWARLDRKGAAFGGAVRAVTQDAVTYVGGLRRYRAIINNDSGAIPIWELAQNNPSNGDEAA